MIGSVAENPLHPCTGLGRRIKYLFVMVSMVSRSNAVDLTEDL
jgi:hypothetical protein